MTEDPHHPNNLQPSDSAGSNVESRDPSDARALSDPAVLHAETKPKEDNGPPLQTATDADSDGPMSNGDGTADSTAEVSERVRWRYAYATAQGPSHIKHDVVCQDAASGSLVALESGSEYVILAVADGAGSALRADRGAELVCSLVIGEIKQRIEDDESLINLDQSRAAEIITWCASRISSIAEAEGVDSRDYAATLLVAVLGPEECAFLQVGDGVIVIQGVESEDEYSPVFWPDRGQYANETLFVTDERAAERFQFERRPGRIAEVALVTDGVQPLVLNYAERLVHTPFFTKTFGLLANEEAGFREALSERLAQALGSPAFAERHDDDKGIAIASRVGVTR